MRAVFKDRNVALATTVAALGYFVDIFDLLLFALVRVRSLKDILATQIAAAQADMLSRTRFTDAAAMERAKDLLADRILRDSGVMLDNILQTTGLVLGGIVWGVLADRLGRLQMLFGSILVYSVANILNAFVADVPADSAFAWLHAVGRSDRTGDCASQCRHPSHTKPRECLEWLCAARYSGWPDTYPQDS